MKKIKNHKRMAVTLCLLIAMITILLIYKLYIPITVLGIAVIINEMTVRKMREQKVLFDTRSRIRNVDCLIIGDINLREAKLLVGDGTVICIYTPDCTLTGAYEVLRHTFSILKEYGGKVILVVKEENLTKKCFSLFEILYFHTVTLNRLGINNKRIALRFPLMFAPVKTLNFLIAASRLRELSDCENKELSLFCEERGISLRLLARQ